MYVATIGLKVFESCIANIEKNIGETKGIGGSAMS